MMDISSEMVDMARQHLRKVRRSGPENIMAICPFHLKGDGEEEKSPSFSMNVLNGLFFCHACKAKGSLRAFFKLLGMSREQMSMHYGLLIEQASKNSPPPPDPLKPGVFDMEPIDDSILGLFDGYDSPLRTEGFTEEAIRFFDVGWDGWHNRITFPIRDMAGKLIGISGRAVYGDQYPRYKVYDREYKVWHEKERLNWDKRKALWNCHNVYAGSYFLQPGGSHVVIVEGFKAAMWMWQCGITSVVALLGSYLSWEQQWMLERVGASVYLFFDNDGAGQRCTRDSGQRLSRAMSGVRVIEYPPELQSDEHAQPDSLSPVQVQEQFDRAVGYPTWLMKKEH
jgi:DNA primase